MAVVFVSSQLSKHLPVNLSILRTYKRRHLAAPMSAQVLIKHYVHQLASNSLEPKSHRKEVKGLQVDNNKILTNHGLMNKFSWINDHVPCFGVKGDNIDVISTPAEFYDSFKSMVKNARRRIVIASLYIGTGQFELDLVKCIEQACENAVQHNFKDFKVHVLLDYNRGSRGVNTSSRTILLPLLNKYRGHVNVYLYHTPDLRGLFKKCIPERFNETVGLTHMKVYMADDDFIISGANLSESYFVNRQDRYIRFSSCPEMANYLCDLVSAVSQFSFHLECNNTTTYPTNAPHPYQGPHSSQVFKDFAEQILSQMNNFWKQSTLSIKSVSYDSEIDTWLYPLIQMGPFNIRYDEYVTETLLESSDVKDSIYLASGYFNLTDRYMDVIVTGSPANFHILTSSPETNGFFGASGISGYVPTAYTQIAKQFYRDVCVSCQSHRISVFEYFKPGWTFHCKGLWYYLANSSQPVLTLIGSPNFGYRSVYRDLECQIAIVTVNSALQIQLRQEHERLYKDSTKVTEKTFEHKDRYVPLWARLFTKVARNFF